ncbi:Phosphate-specific transport system accessory protein PhoU [bacterium HR11]|nr:Phosphate-specific transport system accessory protein PhoU [bacterium HR11]
MSVTVFQGRLRELRERLLYMARLVREMVEASVEGLRRQDPRRLDWVLQTEETVNRLEIEIDERCATVLALHQPEARDLRTILMVLKINNDLERIGDHAVNIVGHARALLSQPPVKPLVDIPRMQELACQMLDLALDAFIYGKEDQARRVCRMDDLVDHLRDQVIRELLTYMMQNPAVIDQALRLILISRDLERVADLSTNIAEDVVYMVTGTVVKHQGGDGPLSHAG